MAEWRWGLHPEFLPPRGVWLQLLLGDFPDPSGTRAWMEEWLWKGCFHETLGQSPGYRRMSHRTESCDKESMASQDPEKTEMRYRARSGDSQKHGSPLP